MPNYKDFDLDVQKNELRNTINGKKYYTIDEATCGPINSKQCSRRICPPPMDR